MRQSRTPLHVQLRARNHVACEQQRQILQRQRPGLQDRRKRRLRFVMIPSSRLSSVLIPHRYPTRWRKARPTAGRWPALTQPRNGPPVPGLGGPRFPASLADDREDLALLHREPGPHPYRHRDTAYSATRAAEAETQTSTAVNRR